MGSDRFSGGGEVAVRTAAGIAAVTDDGAGWNGGTGPRVTGNAGTGATVPVDGRTDDGVTEDGDAGVPV